MSDTLTLLGISGSLRKASYNTATLRALAELMPAGSRLDIADIADISDDGTRKFLGDFAAAFVAQVGSSRAR